MQGEQWRQSSQKHKQCHGGASWLSLVSYIFVVNKNCSPFIIFTFRWLSYTAYPGLLLQLWQHDDLPHILHEVHRELLTSIWLNLLNICRQHGSPDLTYADFIVVQSVWGMTQGLIMPLSGYISRCHQSHHPPNVRRHQGKCFPGGQVPGLPCCLAVSSSLSALLPPGEHCWDKISDDRRMKKLCPKHTVIVPPTNPEHRYIMLIFNLHVRWTLDLGLTWVAFSYGFVSALGQGIALIPTMTIGMRSVLSIMQSEATIQVV